MNPPSFPTRRLAKEFGCTKACRAVSSRPEKTACLTDERTGSVLIIVLVICLGLVSLTLVFGHAMALAYRGADNELAARQAEAAIQGAERYAEVLVANATVPHTLPDRATYQASAVPVGEAFFWFIGEPLASDAQDKPAFGLIDEASKLNLNSANAISLALLPDMTPDLAQAIRQWRTQQGTDTTGSLSFNPVKAAPFESPEELSLVNGGIDPSVLYGNDANLNHVYDPEEGGDTGGNIDTGSGGSPAVTPGGGGGTGQFSPGLLEYVTVFSREPNILSDGTRRGNVTNGFAAIQNALTTALGASRVQSLSSDLRSARRFTSVVEFCRKANLTLDEWNTVAPYLTTGNGTYTVGLVNANTASAAVLAALPGMTPALAQQLVSSRPQAGTTAYGNLQWVVPILGTQADAIGRYLTTRSYQFSVDVAAVGRHGRGYRRTLFVLDTSTDPAGAPQIVYRRNLSNLGWALGGDARKALQDAEAALQGGATR